MNFCLLLHVDVLFMLAYLIIIKPKQCGVFHSTEQISKRRSRKTEAFHPVNLVIRLR